MGKLIQIEVSNFKSYKGHQTIGPFYDFTSIIGPNGAGSRFLTRANEGKSNLMDAISFVLGIKSSQLRSSQLRDLIYRGRILKESNGVHERDDLDEDEDELTQTQRTNGDVEERGPRRAWVMAVYEDDNGKHIRYKRSYQLYYPRSCRITPSGGSEYRINEKVVSAADYSAALEKHNILIKARNFLVFQGDVEAIASQSPKDLTRLIEQISGYVILVSTNLDPSNSKRTTKD
jgi:structural maintenance of chromosome 1